ncbi:hypothetical protein [Rhodocytophaga rosea]|uniref:hypothetical protein n=1 Tax=Rhodocytophaga rosea TaxID=2704465 RepID=UPI001391B9DD|nr:hypothetical protein [Rhodocytophaga rosea]
MKKVTFTVSIEEASTIFKALGKLPFAEVYELIGKLNEQANEQLSQPPASPKTPNGTIKKTRMDLNGILGEED